MSLVEDVHKEPELLTACRVEARELRKRRLQLGGLSLGGTRCWKGQLTIGPIVGLRSTMKYLEDIHV